MPTAAESDLGTTKDAVRLHGRACEYASQAIVRRRHLPKIGVIPIVVAGVGLGIYLFPVFREGFGEQLDEAR